MWTNLISEQEKEKAIKYLIKNIPSKTLFELSKLIEHDGKTWWIKHHHFFGMSVRNLLRKGGFNWSPLILDSIWVELIEVAVKEKVKK